MMLKRDTPEDFVVGTGEAHSVRESCERAFAHVGLDWEPYVEIGPAYFRPTEVEHLHSDPNEHSRSSDGGGG